MNTQKNFLSNPVVVLFGALICCALWGSAFPCIKIGYKMMHIASSDTASQILYAGCRFTLAGILAVFLGSLTQRQFLLIGYDLQNEIRTELLNRGIYKPVSTIITQVRVDPFDTAFSYPTKEIGRYMTAEEAKAEEEKGNHVVEIEGKGYKRVIAAPRPMEIYETDAIKTLMDAGQIVIAAGGGGIPVLQQGTRLKGASAVIEKDVTSACLAEELGADVLLLLTGVEKVCLNFGTDNEQPLDTISVEDATKYIADKQFNEGGMLPKVEAAVSFASSSKEHKAIITSIDTALEGISGKTGTVITC